MHITLIALGKLKSGPLKSLIENYQKRLSWPITLIELESRSKLSGGLLKAQEAQDILKHLPPSSYLVSLDERGESLSSQEFAHLLEHIQSYHQGRLTLVIGGAEGLDPIMREKSQKVLSFGKMTWPHMLARVMIFEQLYRAQQILKGHPYHKD